MKLCLFCKKLPARKKFCSKICIKRAWYVRRFPNSFWGKRTNFWKTETGLGLKWEKWAAKQLNAKHLIFNHKSGDLNWNGKIIDVKADNLSKRKFRRGEPIKSKQSGYWTFNRGKNKPIDFFFCIALIKNKFYKSWLIPSNKFPKVGACMGFFFSKYDKFRFYPNKV